MTYKTIMLNIILTYKHNISFNYFLIFFIYYIVTLYYNYLNVLVISLFFFSFYQPRKDEGLSWPWSHPVVLNTRPLDWESSTLTTRPSLFLNRSEQQIFANFVSRRAFSWKFRGYEGCFPLWSINIWFLIIFFF